MGRSTEDRLALRKNRYGIGVKWDSVGSKTVDLDLQCVIVNDTGIIVDAVYYNNLLAFNGAIGHTGDETTGDQGGYDEVVWVQLNRLPQQVQLIIFVVAAYNEGGLRDASNGRLGLMQELNGCVIRETKLENTAADADAVAMLKRCKDGTWIWCEIDEPAEYGSHFLDILEPTIGDLIRREIPGAPSEQKVTFIMQKGAVIDLPQTTTLKRLAVGIGGTLPPGSKAVVDIDISAVFFSTHSRNIGAVDFSNSSMYGVQHSGDGIAGAQYGDDEALSIDLAQTPDKVSQIFLVLTVKSGGFDLIRSCYARVIDQMCTELVRYDIPAGHRESGLIIARLFRGDTRRWGFQALGAFCNGPTWREASAELVKIAKVSPHQAGDGQSERPAKPPLKQKKKAELANVPMLAAETQASAVAEPIVDATSASMPRQVSLGATLVSAAPAQPPRDEDVGLRRSATSTSIRKGTLRLAAPPLQEADSVLVDGTEDAEQSPARPRTCGSTCTWMEAIPLLRGCAAVQT